LTEWDASPALCSCCHWRDWACTRRLTLPWMVPVSRFVIGLHGAAFPAFCWRSLAQRRQDHAHVGRRGRKRVLALALARDGRQTCMSGLRLRDLLRVPAVTSGVAPTSIILALERPAEVVRLLGGQPARSRFYGAGEPCADRRERVGGGGSGVGGSYAARRRLERTERRIVVT